LCSSSLVFAEIAIDVMLTDDRADNSLLFEDLVLLLAIKLYPKLIGHSQNQQTLRIAQSISIMG